MAQPIPQEWSHLVALNVEYSVLICKGDKCKHAQKPTAISRHLRDRHNTAIELRKQVDQYVQEFSVVYDYDTVLLPNDGLAPQPIIPIVDGFTCLDCLYKTTNRAKMRQHANQAHGKKEVADEELCRVAQLQSWFGEKRERYWAVDRGQQAQLEQQGEESNDLEANVGSGSSSEDSQGDTNDDIYEDIIQGIEDWKAAAKERLLEALRKVPAAEIDSWLQYTSWNKVLSQSKHNLVKTHQFARLPDPDELELERVLRAWRRILEWCLDTLATTDQKDALKWWASPKNEACSQRPFELLQNAESVKKYSAV
jgi:Orsellinic acid/F9775 biosynthesis cluster protein D